MTQLLEKIRALQSAVDGLTEAEARLSGIPDWMRELHEEHAARKAEITALEEVAEQATRERREAEAEIAEIQAKLQRYQTQINQVTTQREYGALLQEIDTAKARITEVEELGLACMARRDEAEAAIQEQREAFQDLDQRYSEELAKWEAEKPSVASQAEELRKRIAELRGEIPRGYLSQYDRVAARHNGDALAPIRELDNLRKGPRSWHCGSCNFNVRPQVLVEVSRKESLLLCDSCKRILYVPEEEEG
ncbi:MAG: hypothetical protein KDD11_00590 [Acidobacteria bacterium]|nr:hypothetical protein [Acidobacteriota bacterium]